MPKSKARKKRPPQRSAGASASFDTRPGVGGARGSRGWDPSGRNGSEGFDAWMVTTWRLRWAVLVTLVAIGTTVVLALVLSAFERDARAFENAAVCGPGRSVGCLTEIPVTIVDRGETGRKNPQYYLDLSGDAPADGEIYLPGETALWDSVSGGDNGVAIVWDGAVVRVEDDSVGGVEGDTGQAPGVRTLLVEGFLIAAAVWALASVVCTARIADYELGDGDGWTRRLVPLEIPLSCAVAAFLVGALAGQGSESLAASVGVGGGVTAFVCLFLLVRRRLKR
jgi:hypothetical protein